MFLIEGIVFYFKMRNIAKRQEESENIDDRKAILPYWLLNPYKANTQTVAAGGGVVGATVGDATVLREEVPTTTTVDAVR